MLDRSGPWEEFASACGNSSLRFSNRVRGFQPMDVVFVDWHGSLVWESICSILSRDGGMPASDEALWQPRSASVCYYNFWVCSASSYKHPSEQFKEEGQSDDQFYYKKEQLLC